VGDVVRKGLLRGWQSRQGDAACSLVQLSVSRQNAGMSPDEISLDESVSYCSRAR
jgi:hypothetical protein